MTTTTAASGTKRAPLSDNPNAANSPLRGSSATALALQGSKKAVRSHADQLREEPYGQPPPAKRQMIEHGGQRAAASPTSSRSHVSNAMRKTSTISRTVERERPERASSRTTNAATATTARAERSHAASTTTTADRITAKELEDLSIWQTSMRSRFHKMVFYFESIPDDQRHKLAKQVALLGAVSQNPLAPSMHAQQSAYTYISVTARGKVLFHRNHPCRHYPPHPSR